ncbi:chondroitinase B-like protein [Salegentibacter sp. 24]|uniref:right-handed parallel beta-helix repeat-containing protein n=1 Tax=Salegentibacter sp. 24 TaxID=2183986 RepID=UPI0010615842|nr:right-handed parallel beta-helix repeat-containing protein [Salegentibacter sp. 24]TDN95447.1 chondroitinase B-like protein [Salegentibacter sp. 24]
MKNLERLFLYTAVFPLILISCNTQDASTEIENPHSENPIEAPLENSVIIVENSDELITALSKVKVGDSIVVKEGTYELDSKIRIFKSGTADKKISLTAAADGERPIFDFSSMSESSSNHGIVLNADFWHIKGLEIFGAGDNGMKIEGNNNIIEFCSFSECHDTGLQLDNGAANNTILNCDSFFNADSSLENADGFACKLSAGTGNKFIGCRAWQNLDDGYDGYLRDTDNIKTIYENCWAFKNGYLKNGIRGSGDGNGFKTGGSDDKNLKHHASYYNCIATGNTGDGFDHNSNRGDILIYNCTAYNNDKDNFGFGGTNRVGKLVIKNSAVLGAPGNFKADEINVSHNSWEEAISATENDFVSLKIDELMAIRKADGSLPEVNFMHLTQGSDLINAGIDVGIPYNGSAPDLGVFEYAN